MNSIISIDGSFGEGGGQILRTSLAFSAILGKPLEVYNIRARRENPGLRKQHIGAIKATSALCQGRAEGLSEGSSTIRFYPGKIRNSFVKLDIGSAGSITLLLQAAIPAAALGGASVEMEISGGTDVKWSPTVEYFRAVVLPAFRNLGVYADMEILRRGYYPEGGGLVRCRVRGSEKEPSPLSLLEFKTPNPSMISVCSRLPPSVAERQVSGAMSILEKEGLEVAGKEVRVEDSPSPGTSMLVYCVYDHGLFIGGDAIGERGKRAERVGEEAAQAFLEAVKAKSPVDNHLADMIVPILAVAKGPSEFAVPRVTQHLLTNLNIAKVFTGCNFSVEERSVNSLVKIFPRLR